MDTMLGLRHLTKDMQDLLLIIRDGVRFKKGCRFTVKHRIGTYFYKGILYGIVGFGCGIIGQGIANLIMRAKRKIAPKFESFKPHKCHILQLHDASGETAHTFENMWDLTPDTDLLMELPEEYNFETALADLIDNSLQAVWSNNKNDRRLIRYDITVVINGLEHLVEASPIAKQVPPVAMAFTVGVRFANNVYGGMQFVDWARWSGVQ
ncbi:hypothetical protein CMV_001509 [Castanea mollissima]|uniref:Uncharacterized protein n=1 Tax=Castanea mollissima TaxID=60419 RepID=A0A8J4VY92_9ROSI|nr:hypothetical protein CMV_001509 [Castanea mollissima]